MNVIIIWVKMIGHRMKRPQRMIKKFGQDDLGKKINVKIIGVNVDF
jgi:hypothetical protein